MHQPLSKSESMITANNVANIEAVDNQTDNSPTDDVKSLPISLCGRSVDDLVKMLDSEYVVYSYLTLDNDPGTIIVDPKLQPVFDTDKLFKMECVKKRSITLREILEKGFLSIGSIDLMETVNITYPNKHLVEGQTNVTKPLIKGMYLHGSRRRLISDPTKIDFDYDPESDHETFDFDENEDDDFNNRDNQEQNQNQSQESESQNRDVENSKKPSGPDLDWLQG